MKASKEAEEIQVVEKCASVCKDFNPEKNNKIKIKFRIL